MKKWKTFSLSDRQLSIADVENYKKITDELICFENGLVADIYGNGYIQIIRKNKNTYINFCTEKMGSKCVKIGPESLAEKIINFKTRSESFYRMDLSKVVFYEELNNGFAIWMNVYPGGTFLEIEGDFD